MLPRDQFERAAAQVMGLHTARHAQLLYGLVRWLRPETVVEVGTFAGGTAVWLARALQENGAGQLHCIDDFSLCPDALPSLFANLGACGVHSLATVYTGPSEDPEAWPERVDFAFIDGDHSAAGCMHDVEQAETRGARCIVVHDIASWWGPRELYDRLTAEGLHGWQYLAGAHDGGLLVLLRAPVLGPVEWTEELAPSGAAVLTLTPDPKGKV